jgi:hypothetical protein
LTIFWEDYYHKHPIDAKRVGDGKEVRFVTNDELLNKWEDELARGLEPDLTEGLSPKERAKELAAIRRNSMQEQVQQEADLSVGVGFTETYGA